MDIKFRWEFLEESLVKFLMREISLTKIFNMNRCMQKKRKESYEVFICFNVVKKSLFNINLANKPNNLS